MTGTFTENKQTCIQYTLTGSVVMKIKKRKFLGFTVYSVFFVMFTDILYLYINSTTYTDSFVIMVSLPIPFAFLSSQQLTFVYHV